MRWGSRERVFLASRSGTRTEPGRAGEQGPSGGSGSSLRHQGRHSSQTSKEGQGGPVGTPVEAQHQRRYEEYASPSAVDVHTARIQDVDSFGRSATEHRASECEQCRYRRIPVPFQSADHDRRVELGTASTAPVRYIVSRQFYQSVYALNALEYAPDRERYATTTTRSYHFASSSSSCTLQPVDSCVNADSWSASICIDA